MSRSNLNEVRTLPKPAWDPPSQDGLGPGLDRSGWVWIRPGRPMPASDDILGLQQPYWVILVTQDEPGRVWTGLGGSGQVWIQLVRRSNGQSALAPYISLHSSYWVILVTQDEPGRVPGWV